MDAVDYKILKILQKKARVPNVEVARKIKMAPSAVLERIKKLEARGIIDGYEVRLNPSRFHRAMIAFVNIYLSTPSATTKVGNILARMEGIQEVHHLAGADCLMAKVRVTDTVDLAKLITEEISAMEEVRSTQTFVVMSTFKETSQIPLPHPDTL